MTNTQPTNGAETMKYNLTETFKPTTEKITPCQKCVWSFEGREIVWGFGKTRREARLSALEAAQYVGLLHRPTR